MTEQIEGKKSWRLAAKFVAVAEMHVVGFIYLCSVSMLAAWTVVTNFWSNVIPHHNNDTSSAFSDIMVPKPNTGLDGATIVMIAESWIILTSFAAFELFFGWLLLEACKPDCKISVAVENICLWRKVKLFCLLLHPTGLCFLLKLPMAFVVVNGLLIIWHIVSTVLMHVFSNELESTTQI